MSKSVSNQTLHQKKTKVVILEDNKTLLNGIRFELEKDDISICGMGEDLDEFLKAVETCRPDVAIVDLRIWNDFEAGFLAITRAKEASPGTKFIVYTAYDEAKYFHRAINLGIKAFVAKKFNETPLDTVVRIVANGGSYFGDMLEKYLDIIKEQPLTLGDSQELLDHGSSQLTSMEVEILKLLDEGCEIKQIAVKKTISPHTVKAHTSNIRKKLGVNSTVEALRVARLRGLIGKGT